MEESGEDSLDRARIAWWLAAAALGVAVAYVVSAFLGTFVLGLFVYYATRPIYGQMQPRIGQPTLAAATALVGLALPALLLVGYTVLLAVRELRALEFDAVEGFVDVLGPAVDASALFDTEQLLTALRTDPSGLLQRGADPVQAVLGSVLSVLGVVASGLLALTIVLVIAFYLLRDGPQLARWVRTELSGESSATVAYFRAVDRDLETVYFGNILTALVVAVVAAVVFNALDVVAPPGASIPAPTLLGLLTGLASLVPVVGMKLVYVPMGLLLAVDAVVNGDGSILFAGAFLLASFVIVDSGPEFLLRPYVSGRNLHTGLVLFAYVIGPILFGWYGLFLGPLLLVLLVHFVRIILPKLIAGDRLAATVSGPNPLSAEDAVAPDGRAAEPRESPTEDDARSAEDSTESAEDGTDPIEAGGDSDEDAGDPTGTER